MKTELNRHACAHAAAAGVPVELLRRLDQKLTEAIAEGAESGVALNILAMELQAAGQLFPTIKFATH